MAARLLVWLAGLLLQTLALAHPLQGGLETALAHYRQLAADPAIQAAWSEPLPPLGARKLEPGKPWAGLPLLARRLTALGDLSPATPPPARYEGELIDAVKAFQRRHGLEADGVIGKHTLAALNIPPATRLKQIELNLDRLRQLPFASRHLLVNVPEFVLRAYAGDEEKLRIRIIVGSAHNHTPTPLFVEEMRYLEFSPYWNVPPSIARKELVPLLRRDPGYFTAEGFEFHDGRRETSAALTEESLDAVLQGRLQLRQRPGPKNALGGVKFVFPNRDNIYMHYTPALRLFAKARRDFSHGCIRVEDPVALVRFVLNDDPAWPKEGILAAMQSGQTRIVRLPEPVPVIITYLTAVADGPEKVSFFPDIYELDGLK
ncbi:L,D-transpeptidase family protein [Sulfuricystis multivorans]|uniref:L,D-transpeptidase family protein n=1 Tax=Sulfuricystis multivorans TaxID=2211108 RepID=UPI0024DF6220|nr:L,D-transpeptidase family protein [Sulfuricystis multivorans]